MEQHATTPYHHTDLGVDLTAVLGDYAAYSFVRCSTVAFGTRGLE